MSARGRPVVGGISGFFFGLFLGITLLSFGILPLNSPLLTFLPIIGLVLGLVLAFTAPIPRRGGGGSAAPTGAPKSGAGAPPK
ncbi:MAG: hypothetical protein ACT4PI_00070 [Actinomycetota bacterium]